MDDNPYKSPESTEVKSLSIIAIVGALLSGTSAIAFVGLAVAAAIEPHPIAIPLVGMSAPFWLGTAGFLYRARG